MPSISMSASVRVVLEAPSQPTRNRARICRVSPALTTVAVTPASSLTQSVISVEKRDASGAFPDLGGEQRLYEVLGAGRAHARTRGKTGRHARLIEGGFQGSQFHSRYAGDEADDVLGHGIGLRVHRIFDTDGAHDLHGAAVQHMGLRMVAGARIGLHQQRVHTESGEQNGEHQPRRAAADDEYGNFFNGVHVRDPDSAVDAS